MKYFRKRVARMRTSPTVINFHRVNVQPQVWSVTPCKLMHLSLS